MNGKDYVNIFVYKHSGFEYNAKTLGYFIFNIWYVFTPFQFVIYYYA